MRLLHSRRCHLAALLSAELLLGQCCPHCLAADTRGAVVSVCWPFGSMPNLLELALQPPMQQMAMRSRLCLRRSCPNRRCGPQSLSLDAILFGTECACTSSLHSGRFTAAAKLMPCSGSVVASEGNGEGWWGRQAVTVAGTLGRQQF